MDRRVALADEGAARVLVHLDDFGGGLDLDVRGTGPGGGQGLLDAVGLSDEDERRVGDLGGLLDGAADDLVRGVVPAHGVDGDSHEGVRERPRVPHTRCDCLGWLQRGQTERFGTFTWSCDAGASPAVCEFPLRGRHGPSPEAGSTGDRSEEKQDRAEILTRKQRTPWNPECGIWWQLSEFLADRCFKSVETQLDLGRV